jgi:hypothetical protein
VVTSAARTEPVNSMDWLPGGPPRADTSPQLSCLTLHVNHRHPTAAAAAVLWGFEWDLATAWHESTPIHLKRVCLHSCHHPSFSLSHLISHLFALRPQVRIEAHCPAKARQQQIPCEPRDVISQPAPWTSAAAAGDEQAKHIKECRFCCGCCCLILCTT